MINVLPVNDAPEAPGTNATLLGEASGFVVLSAHDADVDDLLTCQPNLKLFLGPCRQDNSWPNIKVM